MEQMKYSKIRVVMHFIKWNENSKITEPFLIKRSLCSTLSHINLRHLWICGHRLLVIFNKQFNYQEAEIFRFHLCAKLHYSSGDAVQLQMLTARLLVLPAIVGHQVDQKERKVFLCFSKYHHSYVWKWPACTRIYTPPNSNPLAPKPLMTRQNGDIMSKVEII